MGKATHAPTVKQFGQSPKSAKLRQLNRCNWYDARVHCRVLIGVGPQGRDPRSSGDGRMLAAVGAGKICNVDAVINRWSLTSARLRSRTACIVVVRTRRCQSHPNRQDDTAVIRGKRAGLRVPNTLLCSPALRRSRAPPTPATLKVRSVD